MKIFPSLDAHAHLDPTRTAVELANSGAVLAMTISLDEAALVVGRREPIIVWGVGCHPRNRRSQESFDAKPFRQLAEQTAVVGEIGLDTGSRVPLEVQTPYVQASAGSCLRPSSDGQHPQLPCNRAGDRGAATQASRRTRSALVDRKRRGNAGGRGPWVLFLNPFGCRSALEVSYGCPA